METKITVFLDSNVLFSIAYTGRAKSRSYILFQLQESGVLDICISPLVCEEALLNIRLKKPDNVGLLNELIRRSKIVENIFLPSIPSLMKDLPQNDRIILMTAVYHSADYFLTGNEKDFSDLYNQRIGRTLILKPADFLYGSHPTP